MARPRACPICKKEARPRPENPAAPFCSERCRLVDLGHWLGEDYRVATEEPPAPDGGAGDSPDGNQKRS